jgi:hypothetical protein
MFTGGEIPHLNISIHFCGSKARVLQQRQIRRVELRRRNRRETERGGKGGHSALNRPHSDMQTTLPELSVASAHGEETG